MQIVIVSPALADANNGNWRTAQRWTRFLAPLGRVRVTTHWPDSEAAADDVMLALHARRSAAAIRTWHELRGDAGLGVVLTGTDLHHDIHVSQEAIDSLHRAQALVVLHARGIAGLPAALRSKARVILQSANRRRPLGKTGHHLNVVVAGHLRSEKSPETIFATARLLQDMAGIRLIHIGKALDPELADQATATMQAYPGYRWRGALPHDAVRDAIQRAHVLVHPSRMEGGANVVIEAITSGTPVLASAVDGNIGLLGEDYPGYFPWGDAPSLAAMLTRLRLEQTTGNAMLGQLASAIAARAPLFEPEHERQCVRQLVTDLHRR